jgi:hypothetical protein
VAARYLLATFVLAEDEAPRPPKELLTLAGCSTIADKPQEVTQLFECQWATAWCYANSRTLSGHQVISLFFDEASFREMAEKPTPQHPFAQAFLTACQQLRLVAAVIKTNDYEATRETVEEIAELVGRGSAFHLADRPYGALYLDEVLGAWALDPKTDNHEFHELPHGTAVFNRTADGQWL